MKRRTIIQTSRQLRYTDQHSANTSKSRRRNPLLHPFGSAMAGLGLIVFSCTANGQAVPLGGAEDFAIISYAGVTNTDLLTIVNGNIALTPTTTITGFPPGVVNGVIRYNDTIAQTARGDANSAYTTLGNMASNFSESVLGGNTLAPGVYNYSSGAALNGILTLDAMGDPNAVFVFQIYSTLITATGASVVVINPGLNFASNIYWQVGSSATLGIGTSFTGNILAYSSVTMNTGASLINGRAIALNGAVTLDGNTVGAAAPVVSVAGHYWNGRAGNEWSNTSWSSTVDGLDNLVLGSNADVVFSVNLDTIDPAPINQNTILDTDVTISSLTVNDSAAVTIGSPITPTTLTISATGLTTGININSGAGLTTISSKLELGFLSEEITVNNAAGMLISGVVSGTNGLTKAGTGVLTLTGVNTYTGETLVSEGTLQLGNGITPGASIATSTSVLVAPTGILDIDLATGETFGNSVTDNGLIRWIAPGTNTQASTSVFSGTGSMSVTSPGTTILLGNNTFSGGTTINTSGDVLIGNPNTNTSTPFGTGVLTINNGTIDTYNSQLLQIGVGGYVQTGGEIDMHLQGITPGSYTRYDVTGTANISGGTVFVYDLSGNYVPYGGDMQNIIHSSGALSGVGFTSNYPQSHFYNAAFNVDFYYHQGDTLLYPTITYDSNNANVTWVQDSFRSVPGLTPNQDAVGGGLDDYVAANPGLPDDVIAFLNGQNINVLPGMYDLIAPDELTAIFQMGFTAAETQNANIERHLDRVRQGSAAPTQYTRTTRDSKGGMIEETAMTQASYNRWSVFAEGTGGSSSVDGDLNASGYDFDSMGMTVGADMRVSDCFAFGILGSYVNSDASLVNGGSIEAESYKAAIYATVFKDGFFMDALLGVGKNSYDTRRSSLLGYADGSSDGWELDTLLNAGYNYHRGNWTFTPNASIAYTRVTLDSFNETGSLTPLSYPDQHQESLRTELGATIAYNAVFNGMKVTPQVRIAWQHEFLDSTQSMQSSFVGGGGPTFTVDGPHMGRDRAVLSAGVSMQVTPTVCVYGFYDGIIGSSELTSNQVSIGVKIDF